MASSSSASQSEAITTNQQVGVSGTNAIGVGAGASSVVNITSGDIRTLEIGQEALKASLAAGAATMAGAKDLATDALRANVNAMVIGQDIANTGILAGQNVTLAAIGANQAGTLALIKGSNVLAGVAGQSIAAGAALGVDSLKLVQDMQARSNASNLAILEAAGKVALSATPSNNAGQFLEISSVQSQKTMMMVAAAVVIIAVVYFSTKT